ncbi:hypothetical protein [Saccharomonospora azurea]|uniref:hypothetical protein n=1 Tax=Saccharomonospora azurea TaxID=40988 RepID=UPI00159E4D3B|nr:hypothetical protein [Saccharomonospora azurea]
MFDDLRVAVDRRQDAVDDLGDPVEPHPELGLGLNATDRQRHPAQRHVGPHVQLQQIKDVGMQGHVSPQVLDVEVDLVDGQLRDVEEHVGRGLLGEPPVGMPRVPVASRGLRLGGSGGLGSGVVRAVGVVPLAHHGPPLAWGTPLSNTRSQPRTRCSLTSIRSRNSLEAKRKGE